MGCTPTLAVLVMVAVLETSDEVTAVVVLVVVVIVLVVYCACSSANTTIMINIANISYTVSIYQQGCNWHARSVCIQGYDIFNYLYYIPVTPIS